jgi:hypothetical protein
VLALLVAGAVGAAPVARAGRMAGAAHLRAREGQLAEGAHEGAHESAHAGAHETAHEAAPAGRVRGKSAYTGRVKSWPAVAAVAAWVSVGLLLVLGASGVTARSSVPQRVGADFDSVRLEAAEVGPVQAGQAGTEAGQAGTEAEAGRAQAGTVAPVRLYWSIQGPVEPLVAYVHVVDAAGVVVAQNDGPLGGEFTPAARWRPGLVVPHTHWVPLPRDLPPGEYQVLAGVYRPGDPGAPLVAAGAEAARVPVGVLKVRP